MRMSCATEWLHVAASTALKKQPVHVDPFPCLVTMRLLLRMAMTRNAGITLGNVSTASLDAVISCEVFLRPPIVS